MSTVDDASPARLPTSKEIAYWRCLAEAHYPDFACRLQFRSGPMGAEFSLHFDPRPGAPRVLIPLFARSPRWEPLDLWYRQDEGNFLNWFVGLYPDQQSLVHRPARLHRGTIALMVSTLASYCSSEVAKAALKWYIDSLPLWAKLALAAAWLGARGYSTSCLVAILLDAASEIASTWREMVATVRAAQRALHIGLVVQVFVSGWSIEQWVTAYTWRSSVVLMEFFNHSQQVLLFVMVIAHGISAWKMCSDISQTRSLGDGN